MKLSLDITGAGESTCIKTTIQDGCCPFLRATDGGLWSCLLFREREQLGDTNNDGTGRLLRWSECLDAEIGGRDE